VCLHDERCTSAGRLARRRQGRSTWGTRTYLLAWLHDPPRGGRDLARRHRLAAVSCAPQSKRLKTCAGWG
jgi:hypothetical protein